MAVVLDGSRSQGRIYRAPTDEDISIATSAIPLLKQMEASHNGPFSLVPDEPCRGTFASNAQGGRYGFYTFRDYFTPRQLVTLITFVHLVRETREIVVSDVLKSGLSTTGTSLNLDSEAREYADAVATYLALSLDRSADRGSTICSWDSSPKMEALRNTFARQAISMTWDFAEGNPFSESSGNWMNNIEWITLVLENTPGVRYGFAKLNDATAEITIPRSPLISTDPPYYDNIDYSDLSDFFYVWLRRSLDGLYPDLFGTLLFQRHRN